MSKYARYDIENHTHVFTVEQGTRFYLKLYLRANPPPTSRSLSMNGIVLGSSAGGGGGRGTIQLGVDSVDIQSVQASEAADYTISCTNAYGKGQFSFRLNVVGKGSLFVFAFSQTIIGYYLGLNLIFIFLSTTATNAYRQLRTFDLRDQDYDP